MRKYWFTLLLTISLLLTAVLHVSAGSIDPLTSLGFNLAGSKWTHEDSIDGADSLDETDSIDGADSLEETDRIDATDSLDETDSSHKAGSSDETVDESAIDSASEASGADATDSSGGTNHKNAEEDSDEEKARLDVNAGQTTDFVTSAPFLQPGERPKPPANFEGVLFVGDSRTMGLSEYGDLGNASVFANSGMSVFNVLTARISSGGEKLTLDEVLSRNHYQMIYLMLGINELGYDMSQTIKQYKEVLSKIKEMQPEATMVLEANLHITSEKSEKSPVYSNSKINCLNQEIQKIAEENSCYYIDVNEIFDDEGGSLNHAYSTDGSHVLGKYYAQWVKWLKEESV